MNQKMDNVLWTDEFLQFLVKKEGFLKEAQRKDPSNQEIIWRLVEINRKCGRLIDAIGYCDQIDEGAPQYRKAAWLRAILQGEILSGQLTAGDSHYPAPYHIVHNLLSVSELETIWDKVHKNQERFKVATVGKGEVKKSVDNDLRTAHVLYESQLGELGANFIEKVVEILKTRWAFLNIEAFTVGRREIQLTMHLNGDFFELHKDSAGKAKARKITFVYYFFQEPKAFKGGDLILFDTDASGESHSENYSRIIPENNMLILFPSQTYHMVSPLSLSKDDYSQGRFTLNGWLHSVS